MKTIRLIATGAFGCVEEVEMPDGSRFARKTFAPAPFIAAAGSERKKLLQRFRREVTIQEQLSLLSESFVPVLGSDLNADEPWFLMPIAEQTFAERIAADRAAGRVDPEALIQILDALGELHRLGYTHRDLKPQNVLFVDGKWRLSDFGLVLPPDGSTTKLTSFNSAWGTQAYCAPEQLLDFAGVTASADIYAFGCVLHDLDSGTPRIPYQQHVTSTQLGVVIRKCTAVKAADRFKNVSVLKDALLTALAEPAGQKGSSSAAEWGDQLELIDLLGGGVDLEALADFAERTDPRSPDMWSVFAKFGEGAIAEVRKGDRRHWDRIVGAYCAWVQAGSFDFLYCDVLARRLATIFELGSLDVKVNAVMALADMAVEHNRYFAMGTLVGLCGPDLDLDAAKRIAIEITVDDATETFKRCADRIGKEYAAYHPRIADVLLKSMPLAPAMEGSEFDDDIPF
jgi:hypothetical protein